ncbi:unnamed protein product [Chrysoparadoxa australica]
MAERKLKRQQHTRLRNTHNKFKTWLMRRMMDNSPHKALVSKAIASSTEPEQPTGQGAEADLREMARRNEIRAVKKKFNEGIVKQMKAIFAMLLLPEEKAIQL